MLTHENIWKAIDTLAESFGYSPSGLAKQAGLDATSFNKSKRISPEGKPRWPSTESIARILEATGATMKDFTALIEDGEMPETSKIPLIGTKALESGNCFDTDGFAKGEHWDEMKFPEAGSSAFAVRVDNDALSPRYKRDSVLILAPSDTLKEGDEVLVKKTDGSLEVKEIEDSGHLPTKGAEWLARIIWTSR